MHPVVGGEVSLRVRDDLAVGRMIDGLDPDDLRIQRRIVLGRVAKELELRRRGPDDEDALRAGELVRDGLEEAVRVVGVMVLGRPAAGMLVNVMSRRV